MTDKQIIDGIDVSRCAERSMCINCETVTNCYYKQLKRAEQKLEKIKDICKNVMPTGIDEETDKFDDILQIIEGKDNE
jgi:hypothetical protein